MSERFPVQQAALEICEDVVSQWSTVHCPGKDLAGPTLMLALRVNSWVSGLSVVEGVRDVMSSHLPQTEQMEAAIEELGTRLGHRLLAAGLLIASPRRAGTLS